jgi:hypothetical protein
MYWGICITLPQNWLGVKILSVAPDPEAGLRGNSCGHRQIFSCASLIAGIWLAGERQVNVRVVPPSHAIDESVDLAHEVYNRVFRRVHERMQTKQ